MFGVGTSILRCCLERQDVNPCTRVEISAVYDLVPTNLSSCKCLGRFVVELWWVCIEQQEGNWVFSNVLNFLHSSERANATKVTSTTKS